MTSIATRLAALALALPLASTDALAGGCGYYDDCDAAEYGFHASAYPVRRDYAPPVYRTVYETVVVAPASVQWRRDYDRRGRVVWCKVRVPAVVKTVARDVLVSPGSRVVAYPPLVAGYALRVRYGDWGPYSGWRRSYYGW